MKKTLHYSCKNKGRNFILTSYEDMIKANKQENNNPSIKEILQIIIATQHLKTGQQDNIKYIQVVIILIIIVAIVEIFSTVMQLLH